MTNTYVWGLQNPPRVSKSLDSLTDVVRSVDWCVTATDPTGKYAAYRYGGPFDLPAPSPASFTPFASVTLAMVCGWVQATMGDDQVAALQTSMDAEIVTKMASDADPSTPIPMALVAG